MGRSALPRLPVTITSGCISTSRRTWSSTSSRRRHPISSCSSPRLASSRSATLFTDVYHGAGGHHIVEISAYAAKRAAAYARTPHGCTRRSGAASSARWTRESAPHEYLALGRVFPTRDSRPPSTRISRRRGAPCRRAVTRRRILRPSCASGPDGNRCTSTGACRGPTCSGYSRTRQRPGQCLHAPPVRRPADRAARVARTRAVRGVARRHVARCVGRAGVSSKSWAPSASATGRSGGRPRRAAPLHASPRRDEPDDERREQLSPHGRRSSPDSRGTTTGRASARTSRRLQRARDDHLERLSAARSRRLRARHCSTSHAHSSARATMWRSSHRPSSACSAQLRPPTAWWFGEVFGPVMAYEVRPGRSAGTSHVWRQLPDRGARWRPGGHHRRTEDRRSSGSGPTASGWAIRSGSARSAFSKWR